MSRKHMPLLVGGLVVLLLVVALSYLLFSTQGRYADAASGLTLIQGKLQRLSGRAVFPSAGNVKTLGKQLEIYQEYLDGLYDAMREGQRASLPVNRDGFRRMLENGLRRLVKRCPLQIRGVAPGYGLRGSTLHRRKSAFRRGSPAAGGPVCVHRHAVRNPLRCRHRRVGVGGSHRVRKGCPGRPGGRGIRRPALARNRPEPEAAAPSTELYQDPDGLFTKEHYVLTYRAQDAANRKVLDRLSQGRALRGGDPDGDFQSGPARRGRCPRTEEPESPPKPVSTGGWQSAAPRGPSERGREGRAGNPAAGIARHRGAGIARRPVGSGFLSFCRGRRRRREGGGEPVSQASRGKNDWIRDHYEKAILLVALIALLISSVLLVQRIQADKEAAAFSLARIGWKGSPVALKDTVPFDAILAEARAAATQAQPGTPAPPSANCASPA